MGVGALPHRDVEDQDVQDAQDHLDGQEEEEEECQGVQKDLLRFSGATAPEILRLKLHVLQHMYALID